MQNHTKNPWIIGFYLIVNKKSNDFEKLKQKINYIRNKYNAKIIFCFTEPAHLFLNKNMYKFAMIGGFDKAFCSTKSNTTAIDLVEYAKRQVCDSHIFASIDQLDNEFKNTLQFITKNIHGDKINISPNSILDHHLSHTGEVNLLNLYGTLDGKLSNEKNDPSTRYNLENGSLFSTTNAIERLGNIDNIEKNKITFGNTLAKKYKSIWLVDNNITSKEYLENFPSREKNGNTIKIPGILANMPSYKLLVDINPIEDLAPITTNINFTRTILTIQPFSHTVSDNYSKPFHFITSNYNKEKYILNALYSMILQTYEDIHIHIIDDLSDDRSIDIANKLFNILNKSKITINNIKIPEKLGTYGIRNKIIEAIFDEKEIYAINDSDDFSCAQRAHVQINRLNAKIHKKSINFGDIIRVNENFQITAMDGEVERYGTASMASKMEIHTNLGYYEYIKKNADTEFISRVKYFLGANSIDWFRYPVLFQPFDGNNLTADIYSNNGSEINQNLNSRQKHKDLFTNHHASLNIKDLSNYYKVNQLIHQEEYSEKIPDFLIKTKTAIPTITDNTMQP